MRLKFRMKTFRFFEKERNRLKSNENEFQSIQRRKYRQRNLGKFSMESSSKLRREETWRETFIRVFLLILFFCDSFICCSRWLFHFDFLYFSFQQIAEFHQAYDCVWSWFDSISLILLFPYFSCFILCSTKSENSWIRKMHQSIAATVRKRTRQASRFWWIQLQNSESDTNGRLCETSNQFQNFTRVWYNSWWHVSEWIHLIFVSRRFCTSLFSPVGMCAQSESTNLRTLGVVSQWFWLNSHRTQNCNDE